jgi:hypothetical protein
MPPSEWADKAHTLTQHGELPDGGWRQPEGKIVSLQVPAESDAGVHTVDETGESVHALPEGRQVSDVDSPSDHGVARQQYPSSMVEEGNAVVVVTGDGKNLDESVPEIERGCALRPSLESPELPNLLHTGADHHCSCIGKNPVTTTVVQMAVRMCHGEIGDPQAAHSQLLSHDLDKIDTVLRAAVHQECPFCSDQEKEKGGFPVDARGLSENESDLIQGLDPNGIMNFVAIHRRNPGLVEHRELGRCAQRADRDPNQQ